MERLIVERVLAGNIPDSLKEFRKIVIHTEAEPGQGILSEPHTIELWVLPDYLSIGTNSDWVRMPMGPCCSTDYCRFALLLPSYLLAGGENKRCCRGAHRAIPFQATEGAKHPSYYLSG